MQGEAKEMRPRLGSGSSPPCTGLKKQGLVEASKTAGVERRADESLATCRIHSFAAGYSRGEGFGRRSGGGKK